LSALSQISSADFYIAAKMSRAGLACYASLSDH